MLNQVIIVGRLVGDVRIEKTENGGGTKSTITLAVTRCYKNPDGVYDTDFVDCVLLGTIAENTADYCKKGDVIGVKGRIETRNEENEDGTKTKKTLVIGERVTFLSSNKKEQE